MIVGVTIIGASNKAAPEADECEKGKCLPLDDPAESGTGVLYTASEVEGLEQYPCSWGHNENERNDSDGVGDIGEDLFGQFSPDSDVDDDDDADYEADPLLISENSMAQRAITVVYANTNIISGQTVNEEILRSDMSSAFEDLQRGEEENRETDAHDEYGIAFQEECLASMCRAADLAGIGHHNNAPDESEFDIEEVAKELSLPVDPDNPRSLSLGQYCIDQLMIMQVICTYVVISLRMKTQYIIYELLSSLPSTPQSSSVYG